MAKSDPWPTIHSERGALAGDLEGLTDDQWRTRSLCEDWTVRDVLGHMTATAKIGAGAFFPKLIGSGFSLERMQAKDLVAETAGAPGDTLAGFKAQVQSTKSPPGPADTWLGETIVHSEDIRRPLGIAHDYPTEALIRVADFYKRSNLVMGSKKRIAGLKLRATDTDWSTGDGPEVAGPMLSLVMALSGRKASVADLTGDGVGALTSRVG
jgi:uncharacterized protein (TIGR03083 family)